MSDSGTISDLPNESKKDFTSVSSSLVTRSLAHSALMPSPIKAGVFGIARTTFTGLPNAFSMEATVIPAAIETMTQDGFTTGTICGRISPNLFGFTARNRSSLRCATISFESVVSMEKVVCSFSKVAAEWALAIIWLVFASRTLRCRRSSPVPYFRHQ